MNEYDDRDSQRMVEERAGKEGRGETEVDGVGRDIKELEGLRNKYDASQRQASDLRLKNEELEMSLNSKIKVMFRVEVEGGGFREGGRV